MMLLCKNDDLHNFFSVSIEFLEGFFWQTSTCLQAYTICLISFSFFFKYYNYHVTGAVKSFIPQRFFPLINERKLYTLCHAWLCQIVLEVQERLNVQSSYGYVDTLEEMGPSKLTRHF